MKKPSPRKSSNKKDEYNSLDLIWNRRDVKLARIIGFKLEPRFGSYVIVPVQAADHIGESLSIIQLLVHLAFNSTKIKPNDLTFRNVAIARKAILLCCMADLTEVHAKFMAAKLKPIKFPKILDMGGPPGHIFYLDYKRPGKRR